MKRKWIVYVAISMIIVCGVWGYYSQSCRDTEVYSTQAIVFDNYHKEKITVVVNCLYVKNYQACAEEIVEKCRKMISKVYSSVMITPFRMSWMLQYI